MPVFSWDTPPVFYHSCNYTGPFTDAAVKVIAKFPLVVVEKGMDVDGPGYAEDKIQAALAAVKKVNPAVAGIFYYNSAMDWPFYRMHTQFLTHPEWWLRQWLVLWTCLAVTTCWPCLDVHVVRIHSSKARYDPNS